MEYGESEFKRVLMQVFQVLSCMEPPVERTILYDELHFISKYLTDAVAQIQFVDADDEFIQAIKEQILNDIPISK